MQIGFGYLEVGNVRSKNATSVMMKNMMDSCELYFKPSHFRTWLNEIAHPDF